MSILILKKINKNRAMTKQEIVEQHEYNIKMFQLRIMYAKNHWEAIGLTIQAAMTTVNLARDLAKPMPRFESGGAVVGGNDKAEVVIRS